MEYPMEHTGRRRLSVGVGLFLTCLVLTAVVGLFFGAVPAIQAARLNPIDALRRE